MYKRQERHDPAAGSSDVAEQGLEDGGGADELRPVEVHRPVSYTHLRAHETVLDLVCRLLLEKKKGNLAEPDDHQQIRNPARGANVLHQASGTWASRV